MCQRSEQSVQVHSMWQKSTKVLYEVASEVSTDSPFSRYSLAAVETSNSVMTAAKSLNICCHPSGKSLSGAQG